MSDGIVGGSRVLLLPGWLDSGPAHWQSRWQALHGFVRVEQSDWERPLRGDWMARLDEVLLDEASPVLLAAHSLGCHLVAAWAAHSLQTARVRGALLVAPPDVERDDMPPAVARWRPVVRRRLRSRRPVLLSSDDPFAAAERAQAMAADWGADAVSIGAAGHINGDAGLGDWPEGLAWLTRLGR